MDNYLQSTGRKVPFDKALSEKNRKPNSKFVINKRTQEFRKKYYPSATQGEWNNYHWQLKKKYQSVGDLQTFINLTEEEKQADIPAPIEILMLESPLTMPV